MRSASRADRGAVAVETALLVPLLVTLLYGALQVGVVFTENQELSAAAREAARAVAEDPAMTKAEVVERATEAIDSDEAATVTVEPDVAAPCSGRDGEVVSVTVTRTVALEILFVMSTDVDVGDTATFVCRDDS